MSTTTSTAPHRERSPLPPLLSGERAISEIAEAASDLLPLVTGGDDLLRAGADEILLVSTSSEAPDHLERLHAPTCAQAGPPRHLPALALSWSHACACWGAPWRAVQDTLTPLQSSSLIHTVLDLAQARARLHGLADRIASDRESLRHKDVVEEVLVTLRLFQQALGGSGERQPLLEPCWELLTTWAGAVELSSHVYVLAARADTPSTGVRIRAREGVQVIQGLDLPTAYALAGVRDERPSGWLQEVLASWRAVADSLVSGDGRESSVLAVELRRAGEVEVLAAAALAGHGLVRARSGTRLAAVVPAGLAGPLGCETRGWVVSERLAPTTSTEEEVLLVSLETGRWALPHPERGGRAGHVLAADLAAATAALAT